jgi:hypothetical protein
MPWAAKLAEIADASAGADKAADEGDVVHFLTRTLQAHSLDSEPQKMLTKLKELNKALDQQEVTLSDWPDSPSKQRICAALAKAKILVTRLVDEFGAGHSAPGH